MFENYPGMRDLSQPTTFYKHYDTSEEARKSGKPHA